MTRETRTAISFLALGCLIAGRAGGTMLTGIITQIEQDKERVELREPGTTSPLVPRSGQTVQAGARLTIPQGARIGVVCSTQHFVRIHGPASWTLDAKACSLGRQLSLADYSLIVPRGGRLRVVSGLLGLELEMRGDEGDYLAPVVLSPRNTALRTLRPAISWSRVPGAIEYQIEWTGRGKDTFLLRLDAKNVSCGTSWEGLEVCSILWPADQPELTTNQTSFLKVSARDRLTVPWHESTAAMVHTLDADEQRGLEDRLQDLRCHGLEGVALETARASLLAESNLLGDAAEIYRQILDSSGPPIEVTLADLYLRMGLVRIAESHYTRASGQEDPLVRAAAAFGFGRIEYSLKSYARAASRFRESEEIYRREGLEEEKAAALEAIAKSEARIPR